MPRRSLLRVPRARDVGSNEEGLNGETEDASFLSLSLPHEEQRGTVGSTAALEGVTREKRDRQKTSEQPTRRRDDKDEGFGIEIRDFDKRYYRWRRVAKRPSCNGP